MSKRYIVLPNNVVWDNQLSEVVCRCILEGIGDAENVCQRLNEQQDKITELEIELTDCKNRKEQYEYKNTKLIAKIDFLERVIEGDV